MKIKSVVKVMNFHSLLKVEKARRRAEKYFAYEKGLTDFVDNILNNRNLILDKKMLKLDKKQKPLNIYIGNDLGFCGNFNSNVNKAARDDKESEKIIIGKKILQGKTNVLLALTKEEYLQNTKQIEDLIYDKIINSQISEMNLIYNHYYNVSKIELVKRKILPIEEETYTTKSHKEDFAIEGDINDILVNIIAMYLSYEIRVATENSYASENVARQMLTKESLKKIDEIEEEELRVSRKEKNAKSFKKVIENYVKLKK